MLGYAPQRPLRDAELQATMKRLAQQHPRYGYCRIWALLRRHGEHGSHKRVYRLWQEGGFSLHARRRRRRAGSPSPRPPEATRPHDIWADDFVHNRCAKGEPLKCLAVADEYTRRCLAIEVSHRTDSRQVITVLECLIHTHGVPRYLRRDNGPEFVANAVNAWLSTQGVGAVSSEPGKPWQNGAIDSVSGKFRDECLNMEWFPNCKEARGIIENYRRQYNEERPHSSLAYRTPAEANAGLLLPPTARDQEALCDPSQSTGLTLPLVQ
jgi:putative transposase